VLSAMRTNATAGAYHALIPQLCYQLGRASPSHSLAEADGVTRAPRGFVDGDGWARSRVGRALVADHGLSDACGTLAPGQVFLEPPRSPTARQEEACSRDAKHRSRCTSCHATLAAIWTRNSHKFFHWVVESLPRVASMPRDAARTQLLISCRSPFTRASLAMLGVATDRIVCRRDKVSYATTHELLWPAPAPCGGAREAALRALRASLPPALRPAATGRGGVLLLHERRKQRRLTNHAVVLAGLQARLWRVRVFAGTAPIHEQVAAFRAARCQVGSHGAGLSLMVFAPTDFGTAEVGPGRYFVRSTAGRLHLNRNRNRSGAITGEPNACYRGLAAGLGQRHEWVLISGATANSDLTPAVDDVMAIARLACGGTV